ncbi:helix-turn-helix domain-containing protein [Streptococcus mitis]|jgi:XRE family transcriptional regulator|uniref:helix-turn-helix domain-containing protein n=1 Tax=Streptococcus mitis TaxID=28037 RepID=UPI0019138985|nr:helix-turn-helix transcriptional regulator [Streptococcus mitis]QQQ35227.1 helix-turn-helix transcriptional regulator [Streptococcus mitis]
MNRLKKLRKEKKLSQKEIAKEMSISEKTLSRWENGESQIKPEKSQQLADFFGVSVGYLLGYSDFRDTQELVKKTHENYPVDKAWKVSSVVSQFGELPLEKIKTTYGEALSSSLMEFLGLLSFNYKEMETIYKFLALEDDQKEVIHDLTVKLFNLDNLKKK